MEVSFSSPCLDVAPSVLTYLAEWVRRPCLRGVLPYLEERCAPQWGPGTWRSLLSAQRPQGSPLCSIACPHGWRDFSQAYAVKSPWKPRGQGPRPPSQRIRRRPCTMWSCCPRVVVATRRSSWEQRLCESLGHLNIRVICLLIIEFLSFKIHS